MSLRLFPLLLVSLEAVIYLSNDMYLPALPTMREELAISSRWCEMTITAWLFGSCSLEFLIGPLTHRLGYAVILSLGGTIFIMSSFLCAMSHEITMLIIMRFLQGSSVSAILVAGYACIHDHLPHQKAISTLAWMSSITVLAPALGPLIGGIILHVHPHWQILFWLLGGIAAFLTPLLYRATPKTTRTSELTFKESLNFYKMTFTNPSFLRYTLTMGLIFASLLTWLTVGSLLLHDKWHFTSFGFGNIQALIISNFILGNALIRHLIKKHQALWLVQKAMIIILIGILLFAYSTIQMSEQYYGLVLSLSLINLSSGMIFAPLNRLAIESCQDIPMPLRTASFAFVIGISATIGSLTPTIMTHWMSSYHAFIASTCLFLTLGCSLFLASSNNHTHHQNPA